MTIIARHENNYSMELDWQTQRDLELFQSSVSGQSIFEVLDRTRTMDGRRNLKERFRNPLSSLREIQETQQVVDFISTVALETEFPFSQTDLDHFHLYLHSNFFLFKPGTGLFESLRAKWLCLRNQEYTSFIRQEPWIVIKFLRKVAIIYEQLDSDDCPQQLRDDISFFRTIERVDGVKELLQVSETTSLGSHHWIKWDYLFRKDLKNDLMSLHERLINLDALLSMGKAVKELGLVMPIFSDTNKPFVQICGLYHPFVENPVTNDYEMTENKNLLFLTGPNMAGKTTYMKAVTISLILAHVGMGVPATEMRLTLFSRFFCSLNAVDDIRERVSSFFSEIKRVKEVLEAMQKDGRVFAVFDELFKGTNVKDALDCSNAVIKGLAKWPRHAFLISSHLLELHDLLAESAKIIFFHFDGETLEDKIHFDYRLKPGVNSQRLGFRILQQEGILQLLNEERPVQ